MKHRVVGVTAILPDPARVLLYHPIHKSRGRVAAYGRTHRRKTLSVALPIIDCCH